jgi:hypothetical protein
MRKLVALILVSLLPITTSGCSALECGEGTIERDGTCQPGEDTPGPANCGPGTALAPSGKCESIVFCDPATTVEVLDPDTGATVCIGTGGGGDCSTPLPQCTSASPNTMTVCGRLYDVEDDSQIGAASTDTTACPADGEGTGACSLIIRAFDAIQFSQNPTGTLPLAAAETYLDHCGRFRIRDIVPAGAPFIGLGVRNHPMHDNGNRLTGVAFPTVAGATGGFETDVVAYTTRSSTDTAWANSSGLGGSLAAMGVYVNIYREEGEPNDPLTGDVAPGVTILRGGSQIPNNDYYFSDTDTNRTSVDDDLDETGANGTGLVLGFPSLASYSGTTGPLPGGCSWYTSNGAAIPGVVFVQIHPPVGDGCEF